MWASGLELARRLSRSSLLMVLILFFGEQEYDRIPYDNIEYIVRYRFGCTAGPADPLDPPRLHTLLNADKARTHLSMVLILFFGDREYSTIFYADIEYLVHYLFGYTAGPADPLDPPRLHSLLNTDKAWAYLLMVLILFYSDLEYNILSYDDIYN